MLKRRKIRGLKYIVLTEPNCDKFSGWIDTAFFFLKIYKYLGYLKGKKQTLHNVEAICIQDIFSLYQLKLFD